MRQLWISIAILVAMVALLYGNSCYLIHSVVPLSETIHTAAEAAKRGDWEEAERLTSSVRQKWEASVPYLHFVQCHAAVDEISRQLAEGEAFLFCEATGEFASTCAGIEGSMKEICALERFSGGNLF